MLYFCLFQSLFLIFNMNSMKKIITCLLATVSLFTACGQKSNYETDVFTTRSGKTVKFHALMHSSIRIEYDGREIEIDPCAKLRDRTVDYSAMPKADIILVTHEHFDHYDAATIRQLHKENTQLVMNQRCVELYGGGKAMKNGDQLQLGDDIFVDGRKLSISIASVSLSSAKIHFALNLEDKGTPGDVETIGLYDIDDGKVFNEDNLKDLIFEVVNRFIDEIETIEKDISKTKVLL